MSSCDYTKSFEIIKSVGKNNYLLANAILDSISIFATSIRDLVKNLETIRANARNDRRFNISKMFQKNKAIISELVPEPAMNDLINTVFSFILFVPGIDNFTDALEYKFAPEYKRFNQDLKNIHDEIDSDNTQAMFILQNTQQLFDSLRSEYEANCEEIETLYQTKGADQLLNDRFNELKESFNDKQKKLFDLLKTLNDERVKYNLRMEKNLTKWEEGDLTREYSMQQLMADFSIHLDNLAKYQRGVAESTLKMVNSYDMEKDRSDLGAEILKKPLIERKYITLNMPELPFNLCDFADPNSIFKYELQQYDGILVDDVPDTELHKGDLVVVRGSIDGNLMIEGATTGERAIVTAAFVKGEHQQQRRLMRLNGAFSNGDVNLPAGTIFSADGFGRARVKCTTVSNRVFDFPSNKLSEV